MATKKHEARVELVRNRPGIAAEMLRDLFQVALPAFVDARLQSADLSQLHPTEFRADSVVVLVDTRGDPALAIVVEVQSSCDPDKRYAWPVYLTTLRSRLECDAWLVVIACDARTERWARKPIAIGHRGLVLTPLVVGPATTPLVTDPKLAAERPWLVVLSALVHHNHEQRDELFRTLLDTINGLEDPETGMYLGIVFAGLPMAARHHLEALVNADPDKYIPTFMRPARAEGEAAGKASAVIEVLTVRGLKVSNDVRGRIQSCTDLAQLTDLLKRAVTVRRADDLFA